MKLKLIAIDLAKTSFHVHAVDRNGKALLSEKVSRNNLLLKVSRLPRACVVMEACAGAHHWARAFAAFHEVRLIDPRFVKPFVLSQKNDRNDAKAIAEAASRDGMRFVQVKTSEQLDLQALHRFRQRLVHNRTALANQIRGLLHENGHIAPQGFAKLRALLVGILESTVTSTTLRLIASEAHQELQSVTEKIDLFSQKIEALAKADEACVRLQKLPGIGPLTATALRASVGNGSEFGNGRQMAARLGLVPRQMSTGGKAKLGGITKRGDSYLRTLFCHCARSYLRIAHRRQDKLSIWALETQKRCGHNKAVVALANKLARISWVLLAKGEEFHTKAA